MDYIEFNNKYHVGTRVHYYPVLDDSAYKVTKTRTAAQANAQDQSVVWLEGIAGYVLLDHCVVVQHLHSDLDYVVARFIAETGKTPSKATIFELLEFSYKTFGESRD